jgi:hypothetical protein
MAPRGCPRGSEGADGAGGGSDNFRLLRVFRISSILRIESVLRPFIPAFYPKISPVLAE